MIIVVYSFLGPLEGQELRSIVLLYFDCWFQESTLLQATVSLFQHYLTNYMTVFADDVIVQFPR